MSAPTKFFHIHEIHVLYLDSHLLPVGMGGALGILSLSTGLVSPTAARSCLDTRAASSFKDNAIIALGSMYLHLKMQKKNGPFTA